MAIAPIVNNTRLNQTHLGPDAYARRKMIRTFNPRKWVAESGTTSYCPLLPRRRTPRNDKFRPTSVAASTNP